MADTKTPVFEEVGFREFDRPFETAPVNRPHDKTVHLRAELHKGSIWFQWRSDVSVQLYVY